MKIEVIYALPERQELVTLELPEGSTVMQAVESSTGVCTQPTHHNLARGFQRLAPLDSGRRG